jgi:hypothetical protein
MVGAMARISLARHAAEGFSRIGRLFVGFLSNRHGTIIEVNGRQEARTQSRTQAEPIT